MKKNIRFIELSEGSIEVKISVWDWVYNPIDPVRSNMFVQVRSTEERILPHGKIEVKSGGILLSTSELHGDDLERIIQLVDSKLAMSEAGIQD